MWRLKSTMAQMVKNLPAKQETRVQSLGLEGPLEKEMATHSIILAWEVLWTEEPGGLQFMGSQRAGHNWSNWHARYIKGWTSGTHKTCTNLKDTNEWKSYMKELIKYGSIFKKVLEQAKLIDGRKKMTVVASSAGDGFWLEKSFLGWW